MPSRQVHVSPRQIHSVFGCVQAHSQLNSASRQRDSAKLVYNHFPWPQDATVKQRERVELASQQVLDVREEFPAATVADLYSPLSMPAKLVKAHAALDKAVDRCYRSQPFPSERHRIEYLFELYQQLTAPSSPAPKITAPKKSLE